MALVSIRFCIINRWNPRTWRVFIVVGLGCNCDGRRNGVSTEFILNRVSRFYAILAIILSLLWWKYQHSKDNQDQSRTTLNQRDHTLLGKKGTVLEIGSNGIGRGAFGDTTWRIQGEHLNVNDLVVVERVDGITLLVKKVTE